MEDDEYITNNYEIRDIIKKTNIYSLYRAISKNTRNFVALKIIEKKNMFNYNERENIILSKKFKNRIYSLKNFNSEYFINLIDFIESKNNYYIITELLNDDIEEYLTKNNQCLTIEQIKQIFMNLNNGFNELINSKKINISIILKDILLTNDETNNKNDILNAIGQKINLYGINNLLTNCGISLIENKEKNNYTMVKNGTLDKSKGCIFESMRNIFNSLLKFIKINKDEKEEIENVINICDKKITNEKTILFNEYFNNSFWLSKDNRKDDELLLKTLINYNQKYRTFYNIYQKEIKFIITKETTKEQIKCFSQIQFKFLKKLKLEIKDKDSLLLKDKSILDLLNMISASINNHVSELNLSFNNSRNIYKINDINFPNLLKLDLSNNLLSDINILSNATFLYLNELDLSRNQITNISCLSNFPFTKLKILILDSNLIYNLEVFKTVQFIDSLEKLSLINNKIVNINILKEIKFKNLKELDISNNTLNELNNTLINSKNEQIEIISFNDTKLTDISLLNYKCFINLKEIDLSNNKIKDINDLSKAVCIKLDSLNLSDNEIQDISFLENVPFTNIKTLDLSHNTISDISILKKCNFYKLYELNLCENRIRNVNVFSETKFYNLFELNLSFNKISNIDFLKNVPFTGVEIISFRGNKIDNIDIFKDVAIYYLQEIDLSENQISNIEVLNNDNIFGEIKYIDLRDNDIDTSIENNQLIINKFGNKIEI